MNVARVVNFTLRISGTTDRDVAEWAEMVARYLRAELNELSDAADFPKDIEVSVEDWGEGR